MSDASRPEMSSDREDRADVLYPSLAVLLVLIVFVLVRPPFLLFWYYDLKMGADPDAAQVATARPIEPLTIPVEQLKQGLKPDTRPASADEMDAAVTQEIVNQRTQRSRPPLDADVELAKIAKRHSRDMIERNYLDHLPPGATSLSAAQRVGTQHRGLFGRVTELVGELDTVAATPIEEVARNIVDRWINNVEGRGAILADGVGRTGTGCARSDGGKGHVLYRCTHLFVSPFAEATGPVDTSFRAGANVELSFATQGDSSVGPEAIAEVDLTTGKELSRGKIHSAESSSFSLTLNACPQLCGFVLTLKDQRTRGSIPIAGPYFEVVP